MSDSATSSPAPASASAAGTSVSAAAVAPVIHSFSFAWMETTIHVQVWFLAASLFVWVGDDSASMNSLALAIQSPMESTPSVSCLLGRGHALGSVATPSAAAASADSGEEDQAANGMASRIASVFGLPVFVSLNLAEPSHSLMPGGGGGQDMHFFVERTLLKELRVCQKLGMMQKPQTR